MCGMRCFKIQKVHMFAAMRKAKTVRWEHKCVCTSIHVEFVKQRITAHGEWYLGMGMCMLEYVCASTGLKQRNVKGSTDNGNVWSCIICLLLGFK